MLEKTINQTETFNSWILEMPKEIAEKEGYDIGSKVILTFENGVIKPEIIPPTSPQTTTEVNRIIGKYDRTFQSLKENGD
jgi:hypothetical protein